MKKRCFSKNEVIHLWFQDGEYRRSLKDSTFGVSAINDVLYNSRRAVSEVTLVEPCDAGYHLMAVINREEKLILVNTRIGKKLLPCIPKDYKVYATTKNIGGLFHIKEPWEKDYMINLCTIQNGKQKDQECEK